MDAIRTKAEAIEAMKKSVEYYRTRIEAWEKVTRNYTKTGEPFKVLSKNFNNCTINPGEKIEIHFRDESGRVTYDYINLRRNVYEAKKTYQEEATTPDAIQERINDQLEKYRKWLAVDEKGAEEIESQLDAIEQQLEEIKKAIKAAEETNTHYKMRAYIKNFLGIF